MIYLLYIVVAALIVILSTKASDYVDLLDKKTSLSGAFIGGVMLSAVTSLPELFTSISSTLFLDEPGLAIGNILGSNLFNVAMLSVIVILTFTPFLKGKLSKSHGKVTIFVGLIYLAMVLNMLNVLSFEILTVNITSILIVILYIIGIKSMSTASSPESESEDTSPLTVKQISVRFVLVSLVIISSSIAITYITDEIATIHNLGAGLAGALFLGIATSLPELASTVALFKKRSFDIAFGNIVGSNIFNFVILGLTDILYIGGGVYDFSDTKTQALLIFGTIATPFMYLLIKTKKKWLKFACPVCIVLCYVMFLVY
ncbi:MAG: cation transporter [Clostridia bacterium]